MQVQVTPQYVNPPKRQGGKYGNIKLQDGTLYMVPAHALANFQPGMVANIDFSVQNWGQPGQQQPFNVVTAINGVPVTGQAGAVRGGDQPAPVPQNVPAKPQDRGTEWAPHPQKSEDIFVCGVVNSLLASGTVGVDRLHDITKAAVAAWRDRHTNYPADSTYGLEPPPGDPNAPPDHDPRDEIPF